MNNNNNKLSRKKYIELAKTQIGCGYCDKEKTCKIYDRNINKAKQGCKSFLHHEMASKMGDFKEVYTHEYTSNRQMREIVKNNQEELLMIGSREDKIQLQVIQTHQDAYINLSKNEAESLARELLNLCNPDTNKQTNK